MGRYRSQDHFRPHITIPLFWYWIQHFRWNGTKHTKENWEIIYWFILWERAVSENSYSLRCGDYNHHLSWSTIAFLYNTACDLANDFWALKADSPTPPPSCEAERYHVHILQIIHVTSNAALYTKQWHFKINGDYNHRIVKNTNFQTHARPYPHFIVYLNSTKQQLILPAIMPIHLSHQSCFCTTAATIGTCRVSSIHKCAIVSISAARSPWTEGLLDARQRFDQYAMQQMHLSTATSIVPAKVRRAGIPQRVLKRWLTACSSTKVVLDFFYNVRGVC